MRTVRRAYRLGMIAVAILVLLALSIAFMYSNKTEAVDTIHVLCGAGIMKPMEELRLEFEARHSVKVVMHYGGSGDLLGQLALGRAGDVFVPAARKYVDDALDNGWIREGTERELVKHVPLIVTGRGNPKNIQGLPDLAGRGVTVALGDPEACAIGRVAREILQRNGLLEEVLANVSVQAPTVNQLLLYIVAGHVDAAIIWEDMATWTESQDKPQVVPIPEDSNIIKSIAAGVTTSTEHPALAEAFVQLLDSNFSHEIWSQWGFEPCAD